VGVGGTAALVEWTSFALLIRAARLYYLAAVTVSFIIATAIHYVISARNDIFLEFRRAKNVGI
jgi:putative flippase GtrA